LAKITEELILYDSFSQTFTKYIRQGEQAAGAAKSAQKATDSFTKSQKSAASAADGLTQKIKGLVGAYVGLRGIKELLNLPAHGNRGQS
jgi:hypothetical protein